MSQVLKPIPAPVSSLIWYKDLITPTPPVDQQTPEPAPSKTALIPNEAEPVVEQTIPAFEPVFGITSNTQSAGIRRSSRASVQPSWLKDC